MAINTIYICDRCGKEWLSTDRTEQPVALGICIKFGATGLYTTEQVFSKAMWCRSCVMELGITEPITKEDKEKSHETPISFEDKLIKLLAEIGIYPN